MQADGAQRAAASKGYPARDGRAVDEPRREGGGRKRLRVEFQLSADRRAGLPAAGAVPPRPDTTAALQPKPRPRRRPGSRPEGRLAFGEGKRAIRFARNAHLRNWFHPERKIMKTLRLARSGG